MGNISSVVSFNRTGFVPIVLVFAATISGSGRPFTVPVTTTVVEKVWPIEVANGRLTLVIHSLDRGENAYWVWSGLTDWRIN